MISIIVPVYKVEPYLRCCIESIISQTYNDIEILLIDDGSPDNCGKICEEYAKKDGRIRVFHSENHGLSAARNLGIKEARGEYIGFVDSDDWIEKDMYKVLWEEANKFGADVCECGFWFESDTSKYPELNAAVYRGKDALEALFKNRVCHVVWNKIYKRVLFNSVSFPEGRNIEDISIMHLLIEQANTVVVISEKQYHYRQRADSIKYTYTSKNLIDYADAFLDRYYYYIKNKDILCTIDEEEQLLKAALGISRVWRWWYVCEEKDRQKYSKRISELKQFTKDHIPFWGCSSWPVFLRCSSVFMHSDSNISFMALYYLNQFFRMIRPAESNIIK